MKSFQTTSNTNVSTGINPVRVPNPYLGYRNFFDSRGKFKYYIYPDDNWDKKHGKKPLLGSVYADDPFYATREAYTKGLVPTNFTFGIIAVLEKLDKDQTTSRRYNDK